jgi:hypothetical protein
MTMLKTDIEPSEITFIDLPWATEVLEEHFDDAISMLSSDSIVYGGALRDILAGMPIGGDLDVGCSSNSYKNMIRKFDQSARWVEKSKSNGGIKPFELGGYKRKGTSVVSNLKNFTNMSGADVQIIEANFNKGTEPIDQAIMLAKTVDIICCGLFMDFNGDLYEAVPGAYSDCRRRILRLNPSITFEDHKPEILQARIDKLVSRGWRDKVELKNKLEEKKNG